MADIQLHYRISRRHVTGSGTGVERGNLGAGRGKVRIALVPGGLYELGQQGRQTVNRVIEMLRKGGMALYTMHLQPDMDGAAPANTHTIAQRHQAGRLADEAILRHRAIVPQVRGDPDNAIDRITLLITGQQQAQLSLMAVPMLLRESL